MVLLSQLAKPDTQVSVHVPSGLHTLLAVLSLAMQLLGQLVQVTAVIAVLTCRHNSKHRLNMLLWSVLSRHS
jgi:hypothetical protein